MAKTTASPSQVRDGTGDPAGSPLASLRGLDPALEEQLEPKTTKGRRSRAALQEAARRVFDREGFAGARVVDMAEEADFSLGAFYRYFRDKRDVLMSLLDQLFADMYELARAPWEPGDPQKSVYLTTVRYLEMYRDNSDLYRVMIEAAQTEPLIEEVWHGARKSFYDRIGRALRRGQQEGTVRAEVDPDLAAALLGGMTEHYAYLMFVSDRGLDRDIDAVSKQVAELWASGTFVAPARKPRRKRGS